LISLKKTLQEIAGFFLPVRANSQSSKMVARLRSPPITTSKSMTASFQIQHSAMLLKYSGISFISGAVNHGFFSGERSL
jgi:hypothetical protein